MKVLMLLEGLGSGGAERQMCFLADGLRRRGHEVSVATYCPQDFYKPLLDRAGVEHVPLSAEGRLGRARAVRRLLRGRRADVVLAFLQGPCLFAELASLPSRKWGLVVSERIAAPARRGFDWRRELHRLADCVTTNSHTNRLQLEKTVPGLVGKVITVYNAVDLGAFRPIPRSALSGAGPLRLVVAATYHPRKNVEGLVRAVALLRATRPEVECRVDWYGAVPEDRGVYEGASRLIQELGLSGRFELRPATRDIVGVYQDADAIVLPSHYEGLPNAICEAMACGKPVLMSAVCDAGNLVQEGRNGFLFDPRSPEEIARAVASLESLGPAGREALGEESRRMARRMFAPDAYVDRYADILEAAAARNRVTVSHWVPDVPATAAASVA